MSFKAYFVAIIASSLMWAGAFDVARHAYREGQEAHLIPNLDIVVTFRGALDGDSI